MARTAATVALAGAERRAALEEKGWICWNETLSVVPRQGERANSFAQRVIQSMGTNRRTVYLTIDDSAASAAALNTLLNRLEDQDYTMITALEPRL